jgi:TrwC relaxase
MLRVTTLFAGTAATTAAYYTAYLTKAGGELPGKWMGRQAAGFGLTGDVATDQLEALLLGRDPIDGTPLGKVFADRTKADGTVVRAVAGFDATLSAPLCRVRHNGAYAESVIMPIGVVGLAVCRLVRGGVRCWCSA